jgi:hypothetical protein
MELRSEGERSGPIRDSSSNRNVVFLLSSVNGSLDNLLEGFVEEEVGFVFVVDEDDVRPFPTS